MKKMREDFGIIVACCAHDYIFAQATCASIRYFMGDTPICLLVDGYSPSAVRNMEKAYNVQVINRLNVSNDFLKKNSFGWGLTKMISFWESPWTNFLYLDADTIAWGDIFQEISTLFKDFDLVIDLPKSHNSDETISHFFFDIPAVEKYFPDFDWRKYRDYYFCTGTFFSRRNVFSLEEYKDMLYFMSQHPGVFKFGEMGLLNYMIFRSYQEGKIKLISKDIQWIMPDFSIEQEQKRFPISKNGYISDSDVGEPTVLHWCGPKPYNSVTGVYLEPMDFFRQKFMEDAFGFKGLAAKAAISYEELALNLYFKKKNLGNFFKNRKGTH